MNVIQWIALMAVVDAAMVYGLRWLFWALS